MFVESTSPQRPKGSRQKPLTDRKLCSSHKGRKDSDRRRERDGGKGGREEGGGVDGSGAKGGETEGGGGKGE